MATETISKTRAMLRANAVLAQPIGVDKENKIIRGYVVAELGPFKSGRGVFDLDSLKEIVRLMNEQPDGVKVRLGHPDGTTAEAVASFIGWAKRARLDGDCVRADLHLSPVAFLSVGGGTSRGDYLLTRAELEPASLGSSLELDCDMAYRLDASGHPMLSDEGDLLPPVWIPTLIVASDIVDDGDAVHGGLLAREQLDRVKQVEEYVLANAPKVPGKAKSAEEVELRRLHRNRKLTLNQSEKK